MSLTFGHFVICRYASTTVKQMMNNLPRNMKIAPIEPTAPNLKAFFTMRMKAFHADIQKFFEANAI